MEKFSGKRPPTPRSLIERTKETVPECLLVDFSPFLHQDFANLAQELAPTSLPESTYASVRYLLTASDTLVERQPTGRVGKPEDLAGLVVFLSTLAGAHSVGEYQTSPSPLR